MNKVFASIVVCLIGCINILSAQLIAFPTAEGAGKNVSGGRGNITTAPTVIEVTSLIDNSTAANTVGTFRYACTKSGFTNRIIVFRISGTIHLYAALTLNRSNTTIAGQTAPGEGICVADYPVKVGATNVIIRYLRFRLGDKNQAASMGNDDALDGVGAKKVIIDHCTMSWSNDEACTFYSGDSVTLQWNILSEPLDYSFHNEGTGIQNHAYGGIWGGKHASFHHNLIAHCRGRMPRFDGIRNIPADTGDFRNNVVYNWADYNTNGGEGGAYNVVNNYYKWGPNTPNNTTSGVNRRNMLMQPYNQASPVLPYGKYFLSGNYCDNSTTITTQNWKGVSFSGGSFSDSTNSKMSVPFNVVSINMQTALDAYNDVLATAGCSLPNRDTIDQRIVYDVINRTGKLINVQGGFPAGTLYSISQIAWPALANGTAQTDTDKDGMPDNWEKARGLNPLSAADLNGYISTSGYSNIENYINGDTIVALGKISECITTKKVVMNNSGNWLFAKDSTYSYYLSTEYTAATDSNHVAAALLDSDNFGNFNTSYYTTSTVRYDPQTGKPYLNRNISISPENPSLVTASVTIRLFISKTEFNALKAADPSISSINDLVVIAGDDNNCITSLPAVYTVINPIAAGVFGTYQTGYFIEFETTNFTTYFLGGKISFPLPLKLELFTAILNSNIVTLNWSTSNEFNSRNFIVEKSIDGIYFNSIGTVAAKNNLQNSYLFNTGMLRSSIEYFRLKMMDQDGRFVYSPVLVLKNNSKTITISPNPAENYLVISHPPALENAVIKIIQISGTELLRITLQHTAVSTVVNTSSLLPGIYLMLFNMGADNKVIRFVKQ